MRSPFDARFFKVLAEVAHARLGAQHACTVAAQTAVASEDPLVLRQARLEIDALTPDTQNSLLEETHRRLAMDISAIWDQLPTAPDSDRTH